VLVIDAALGLGVLLVVPVGVALHPDIPRWGAAVAAIAAVPAAVSLALPRGPVAGALVGPLAILAVACGLVALAGWARGGREVFGLARPLVFAYLGVGVVWLGADRLALEPAGFAPPFVQLTAVHFVYAGFASTLLAVLTWRHLHARLPRTSALTLALVAGGPPLVALGFTVVALLLTAGAVVLTAGLYLVAALWWWALTPETDPPARYLLRVAAIAVVVPMLLAVHWAAGATFGFRSLSIPTMAMTHGVVNAVGFVGFGLLGWLLLTPARDGPGDRGRGAAARTGPPRHGTVGPRGGRRRS
jgi:hypothetical protein